MPLRRRILALVSATLLAFVIAVGPAGAVGANNVVMVENTTAGQTLVSTSTQVVPTPMDTITSGNVAIAINADCVGCHSTAVAVQILIVVGSPSNFGPGNAAVAVNGACDNCGAFAYARQYFIQTNRPFQLSGATRQAIDVLRQDIAAAAADPQYLPSDAATDPCVPLPNLPPPPPGCLMRSQKLEIALNGLTDSLIALVTNDLQQSGATTSVLLDRVEETAPAP
jgi:hypothetical protein